MVQKAQIFDDLARLAGGAVNVISAVRQQVRDEVRQRVEEMADRMDLVPREDFQRLEGMVAKSRMEQEKLEKRLSALEGKSRPAAATAKKAAAPAKKKKKKKS